MTEAAADVTCCRAVGAGTGLRVSPVGVLDERLTIQINHDMTVERTDGEGGVPVKMRSQTGKIFQSLFSMALCGSLYR